MAEIEVIDHEETREDIESLNYAIRWWEKKRILFNIVVGAAGLLTLFLAPFGLFAFDIFGIVAWGLMANLMYSVGLLLEVFDKHYFNSAFKFYKYRMVLFVLGLMAYTGVTLLFGMVYFTYPFGLISPT